MSRDEGWEHSTATKARIASTQRNRAIVERMAIPKDLPEAQFLATVRELRASHGDTRDLSRKLWTLAQSLVI